MSHTQDLMEMLAQASTFSRGVPVKQDESICLVKVSKAKKERNTQKNVKTDEEEMYRHIIGYDNYDDDDDGFVDGFNNADVNDFEIETVQNNLSSRHHSRNRYKNPNAIKANNNRFGMGRGRVLKNDFINSISSNWKVDRSRSSAESSHQELNDRVISEQLREVVGCGNSNEEIENGFYQLFSKTVAKNQITDERNLYSKDDSSSISSCNSATSSRKSNHSAKQLYIPPPLRSRNNVESVPRKSAESLTVLDDYKNYDEDNLLIGWRTNENIKPINLYRHLPPLECIASKVDNVYEISDDSIEDGNIKKKHENTGDDSSDEDVKIVEVTEHSSDEIPKLNLNLIEPEYGFKVKVKEKEKSLKSGGRNALINALLKKNADSLAKKSPEPEEKTVKEEDSDINYFEKNDSNKKEESINDIVLNDCSLSRDLSDEGTASSDCGDFIWFSGSSTDNSSKCSSPISVKFNSSAIKCTRVTKTYTESIMDKNKKTRCITLGDFLSPDSLSSSNMSSLNNSVLNPEAPSFLPSFLDNDKSCDFSLLDYNNFPPL